MGLCKTFALFFLLGLCKTFALLILLGLCKTFALLILLGLCKTFALFFLLGLCRAFVLLFLSGGRLYVARDLFPGRAGKNAQTDGDRIDDHEQRGQEDGGQQFMKGSIDPLPFEKRRQKRLQCKGQVKGKQKDVPDECAEHDQCGGIAEHCGGNDLVSVIEGEPRTGDHGDGHEQEGEEQIEEPEAEGRKKFAETAKSVRKEQLEQPVSHALVAIDRIFEGRGLIFVDDGVGYVTGAFSFQHGLQGEFSIFAHAHAFPTVVAAQDVRAHHHARARQHLVGVQGGAHVAGDAAVAYVIQSRYARPHVLIDVFAVFKALCDLYTRIEGVVHAGDKVVVHQIVRIEADKGFVVVVLREDLAESVL